MRDYAGHAGNVGMNNETVDGRPQWTKLVCSNGLIGERSTLKQQTPCLTSLKGNRRRGWTRFSDRKEGRKLMLKVADRHQNCLLID